MFSIFLFCLAYQANDQYVYFDTGMSSHTSDALVLERFTEYFIFNPDRQQTAHIEVYCTDAGGEPLAALEGKRSSLELKIGPKQYYRFLPALVNGLHYTGYVRVVSNTPLIMANRRRFAYDDEILTDLMQPMRNNLTLPAQYVIPSARVNPFTNPILDAKTSAGFTSVFTITENPTLAIRNTFDFTSTMIVEAYESSTGQAYPSFQMDIGPLAVKEESLDDLFPGSDTLRLRLSNRSGNSLPYYRLSSQRTQPGMDTAAPTQDPLPVFIGPDHSTRITVTPKNSAALMLGGGTVHLMPSGDTYALSVRTKTPGRNQEFDLSQILPYYAEEQIGVVTFNVPRSLHQASILETIDGETRLNAMTPLDTAMTFINWRSGQDMLQFYNEHDQGIAVRLVGTDGESEIATYITAPPGLSAFELPDMFVDNSPYLIIQRKSPKSIFASYIRYDEGGSLVEQYPLLTMAADPQLQSLQEEIPVWQDNDAPLCNGKIGATILDFIAYINNDYSCTNP